MITCISHAKLIANAFSEHCDGLFGMAMKAKGFGVEGSAYRCSTLLQLIHSRSKPATRQAGHRSSPSLLGLGTIQERRNRRRTIKKGDGGFAFPTPFAPLKGGSPNWTILSCLIPNNKGLADLSSCAQSNDLSMQRGFRTLRLVHSLRKRCVCGSTKTRHTGTKFKAVIFGRPSAAPTAREIPFISQCARSRLVI